MSDIDAQLIWESYKSKIINERHQRHAESIDPTDFADYGTLDLDMDDTGYGGIELADNPPADARIKGLADYNAAQMEVLRDYLRNLPMNAGKSKEEIAKLMHAAFLEPNTRTLLRKLLAYRHPESFDYSTRSEDI